MNTTSIQISPNHVITADQIVAGRATINQIRSYGSLNQGTQMQTVHLDSNKIPHIERPMGLQHQYMGGSGDYGPIKNKFDVFDDEYDWVLEIPGVDEDQLEIYLLDNQLFVELSEFNGKEGPVKTSIILADGDEINEAHVTLGILTISIKRPFTREEVSVSFS